jgi:hypothetical protein
MAIFKIKLQMGTGTTGTGQYGTGHVSYFKMELQILLVLQSNKK